MGKLVKVLKKEISVPEANFSPIELKRLKQCRNLHNIIIIDKEGSLLETQWFNVGEELGWDFARLLGKGAKFRLGTKLPNRNELTKADKDLWNFIESKSNGKFKFESLVKKRLNYVNRNRLRLVTQTLYKQGWLVRCEDKGNKLVLVEKSWEDSQAANLSSQLLPVTNHFRIDINGTTLPRSYFLPKTHKPTPIVGRPIVSYIGVEQPFKKIILKTLREYLKDCESNYIRVNDVINNLKEVPNGFAIILGDIKSMFTSIPRTELLSFLESEFDELQGVVAQHLSETFLTYDNDIYYMKDGIDMGSSVSPMLACAYVSYLEKKILKSLREIGVETFILRYVDDISIVCPDLMTEIVQQFYEKGLKPGLKVEWKGSSNTFKEAILMDTKLIVRTKEALIGKSWYQLNLKQPVQSSRRINTMFVEKRVSSLKDAGEMPKQVRYSSIRADTKRRIDRFDIIGLNPQMKAMQTSNIMFTAFGVKLGRKEGRKNISNRILKIELSYLPCLDSIKEIRKYMKEFLNERLLKANQVSKIYDRISIRWKYLSSKSSHLLMIKAPRLKVSKVADDDIFGRMSKQSSELQ